MGFFSLEGRTSFWVFGRDGCWDRLFCRIEVVFCFRVALGFFVVWETSSFFCCSGERFYVRYSWVFICVVGLLVFIEGEIEV